MQITDVTTTIGEQSGLQSAFRQLMSQQQLLALCFLDVSTTEADRLHLRLAQLDAIFVTQTPLTVLLPSPAISQLRDHFSDWFQDADGATDLAAILARHQLIWQVGSRRLDLTNHGLIYAIMNITPDSFYDGGRYTTEDAVLSHVDAMLAAGADVIEVNGQSTRPGYEEVSPEVEIQRTIPYIKAIKQRFGDVLVAIDTYKPAVMAAALDADVDIMNDINSFDDDPIKLTMMGQSTVGVLTMLNMRQHNFSRLTAEMRQFFKDNLQKLKAAGVDERRIALDPGIGFSNVADSQLDYPMMRNMAWFNDFNRPLMIAISNKGYLAKLLDLKKTERLPMTLVNEALMMKQGGRILRVHDVLETKQLVTLFDRIQAGYRTPEEN